MLCAALFESVIHAFRLSASSDHALALCTPNNPFAFSAAKNPDRKTATTPLILLHPQHLALNADRNAVLAPPNAAFKQRHGATPHHNRSTQRRVQHNAAAGLQRHHVGQPHRLLIQHNIQLNVGIPQLLSQMGFPN